MDFEMTWILVHPNGYTSPEYDDLPESLMQSSKGTVGLKYRSDRDKISEVREWTGAQWRDLQGDDREFALNWIMSEFSSDQQEGRKHMAETTTTTTKRKTSTRKRPARKKATARKTATKRKATAKRTTKAKTAAKSKGGRKPDPKLVARNKKIIAARKKGRTYVDIADEFGLTHGTVFAICKKAMPDSITPRG